MKRNGKGNLFICTDTNGNMSDAEVVLVLDYDLWENPEITEELRDAYRNGTKIILLNTGKEKGIKRPFVYREINCDSLQQFFKQLSKILIQLGCGIGLNGYGDLQEALKGVRASADAQWLAILYQLSRKAMIISRKNTITSECAGWMKNLSLLGKHTDECASCFTIYNNYGMAV